MKLNLTLLVVLALLSGCARFSTTQTDVRDETTTTVTTKAKAWTFFQARSELANWKAEQNEGTQGAEVGSLNQTADSTNAVAIIEGLVRIAEALK